VFFAECYRYALGRRVHLRLANRLDPNQTSLNVVLASRISLAGSNVTLQISCYF